MPSKIPTLLKYKVLSYFGPALRGRFGPGPYIALMLLFGLYGALTGFGIGYLLGTFTEAQVVNLFGAVFAGAMSFGFVFSLGTGTTAQASELDFIMTTPVKPREWLVSDMLFQFSLMILAGGAFGAFAAVGLVISLDLSITIVVSLLLVGAAYAIMVFMVVQMLVIFKILYPRAHIGAIALILLVLSLIPAVSVAVPDFPIQFSGLPIPQAAFAELEASILNSTPLPATALMYGVLWFVGIAAAWYYLSGSYIFHGVKPTLSAGFGQVDVGIRMAKQRRLMSAISGVTTTVKLRTDTGGDLGFLTRFHLIRIWRDGSILFVVLIIFISIVPSFFSSSGADRSAQTSQASMQIMTIPIAILAVNWSYYERENLWAVVTAGRSLVNYFRGMMIAFAALAIVVASGLVLALQYATGAGLSVPELTLPILSPLCASIAATSMLTRFRILPAAFSPMILVVLFGTIIAGFGGGFALQLVISGSESLGAGVQLAELAGMAVALALFGEAVVGSLAKGFRL